MTKQTSPRAGRTKPIARAERSVFASPADGDEARLFTAGPIERRKQLVERLVYVALLLTTALLVVPLVAILGFLLVKHGLSFRGRSSSKIRRTT